MDSSVASIVAACISAVASVIVALIGKSSPARAKRRGEPQCVYIIPSTNKRVWTVGILILSLWLLLSPTVIHWDWADTNFIIIAIVTLLLSGISPIRPSGAAAVVLMLYAANFFMVPIGWWLQDVSISFRPRDLGYFLFMGGGEHRSLMESRPLARS